MADLIFKTPEIDAEKLQAAANAAAEKAFLKEIEDYYNSYNSPYRKEVRKHLEAQKLSFPIELPDIVKKINESLSAEIDRIANEAVAMTYMDIVNRALVRIEKSVKMSDVLRMIFEEIRPDENEYDTFTFSYKKDKYENWLRCDLTTPNGAYDFTLHTTGFYRSKEDEKELEMAKGIRYQLLNFPYTNGKKQMVIYKDDVKIEMPFTPDIINDKVFLVFMKLMLSKCEIEMDCSSFPDDMFPTEE